MKVLLCERSFTGHRKNYLQRLSAMEGIDFFSYAPENTGLPESRFTAFDSRDNKKSLRCYLKWIRQIRRIVRQNGIDAVHFLDGDSLMRYFGLGLYSLGCGRVIITYHHLFEGFLRRVSYRMMNAGHSHCCVVHTDVLQSSFEKYGISGVFHCEYPAFDFDLIAEMNASQCKARFDLSESVPVIGIVGGMTSYKHIIPYLTVLRECREDFRLLLCGKPVDVREDDIRNAVAPYRDKVRTLLRTLDNDEYRAAIAASDLIYCLYGTDFNGASGPLTDGVCAHKMILSCAHGSLGEITSRNHLGVTADVTDDAEILKQTECALSGVYAFQYDETAEAYRNTLRPETFLETYKSIYLDR